MAVARVVKWQGGNPEAVRAAMSEVAAQVDQGPPEGLPSTGFTMLVGDDGSVIAVSLFANAADAEVGDRILNEMSPPGEGFGTRGPVEFYDVVVDVRM
jgi:hypothetical protein